MTEGIQETVDGVLADDIDLGFVPRPLDTVTQTEIDGEVILIDEAKGLIHALDAVGSIVWDCFDGTVDLEELSGELAVAFNAPIDTVKNDVLEMTKNLARVGVLTGIAAPPAPEYAEPPGLDVGEELPGFRLPDLEGAEVDLSDLRGRHVLLFNWSPHCGYCTQISEQLAELQPALAERETEVVFVTYDDADANRALAGEHGLTGRMLLRDKAGDDFDDPFPNMGTPYAYLLDPGGRVAEPIAAGAVSVPALARLAAGVEVEEPAEPEVAYLPGGAEVCAPGTGAAKKIREWQPTVAYKVGEYLVGVRTDAPSTDALVGKLLAEHRQGEDPNAPSNYSVVLGGAATGPARDLCLLLQGTVTVVRSRSPRRVLLGLAAYLSALVDGSDDGLIKTTTLAAVKDGEAVLLPAAVAFSIEKVQPRLAKLGYGLVDQPLALVDLERRELVVQAPRVALDVSALEELVEPRASRAERPPAESGRYPLRAWMMPRPPEAAAEPSRAWSVAAAMTTIVTEPDKLVATSGRVAGLFEQVSALTVPHGELDEFVDNIATQLKAAG